MEDTPLQMTTRILRSALGRTAGIDILAEYDYSTEMRIHGKDFAISLGLSVGNTAGTFNESVK